MAKQHEFKSQTAKFLNEKDSAVAVDHALSGAVLPAIKEGIIGSFKMFAITISVILLSVKWIQSQLRDDATVTQP